MTVSYLIFCLMLIPFFIWYQSLDSRAHLFISVTAVYLILSVATQNGLMLNLRDPFCLFLLWAVLSNSWSTCAKQSWVDTLFWISAFTVYECGRLTAVEEVFRMIALTVIPILIVVAVQVTKMRKGYLATGQRPGGVFGNNVHLGAYLTVCLFCGLWLTANASIWYLLIVFPTGAMIGLTRSKGALLASVVCLPIAAGMMSPMTASSLAAAGISAAVLIAAGYYARLYPSSLVERIVFYVLACETISRRPLHGWGLRTFRREQFFAYERIRTKYPGLYKRLLQPKTHRVHNDYLEIAHETGLVGLGLFAWTLFNIDLPGDMLQALPLIAVLIMSLMFFPLREPHIAIPFWAIAGSIQGPGEAPPLSGLLSLLILLALSIVTYQYGVKKLLALYWWYRIPKTADPEKRQQAIFKAHLLDPFNNRYLMYLYKASVRRNPQFAMECAGRIFEHFDGAITARSVSEIKPQFIAKSAPVKPPASGSRTQGRTSKKKKRKKP